MSIFRMSDFQGAISRAKECQRKAGLADDHPHYRTAEYWKRVSSRAFWLIEHRNRQRDNTYGAQDTDDKLTDLLGGILDVSAAVCKCELVTA